VLRSGTASGLLRSTRSGAYVALLALVGIASAWAAEPRREGTTGATDSSIQVPPGSPSDQTTSDAPHDVPDLGLSAAQKQTIYQSAASQHAKKSAEPVGFRAAVGAHVPDAIQTAPLPNAVVDLVPKLKDFHYALVANQVLIVDPRSKTVLEVITQ
jgi:hypothetical protein